MLAVRGEPRGPEAARHPARDGDPADRRARLRALERTALPEIRLAEDAGVTQRVAAGLRVDAQAVRLAAHGNAGEQLSVLRVDRVDLGVVAAGQPDHLPVPGHSPPL